MTTSDAGDGGAGGRSALVLGATGLVGGHCVELLLADPAYARVAVLVRRPLGRAHPKLAEHVAELERMEERPELFAVDDVFCCLGTTIRKAGSQEAFRRVDVEYPARAARLAASQGARHFLLVTAVGADAGSRVFYNRSKGEAEAAVSAAGVPGVAIARPSLILGDRAERRPAEALAQRVMGSLGFLFAGPLRRYRAIRGEAVARALVRLAKEGVAGVRVVENEELQRLGGGGGA
jgi:uncharacterized protein YbjT (DUF2867 family)